MTTVTVGLVADPGLPQIIVESVVDDLRQQLTNNATSQTTWRVQTSRETLPLNAEGEIPFRSLADRLEHEEHWDYFIYLTDLPRFTDGTPVLCEIGYTTNAAFISLPALGAAALKSKVQKLILVLLHLMDENKAATNGDLSRKLSIGRIDFQSGDVRYLTAPGGLNRLRLLMGMVRSNRPGRLVTALSSSVAAAAATAAFGVFYTSIWNLADALSPIRLLLISVLAITALSTWLIIHNGLWNSTGPMLTPRDTARDNTSTILTVLLSVTLMYTILYLMVLSGSLVVISSEYLQSQLHHPVGFTDYAKLSWLAASLGTTAGALGSNFDSDEAIREATYSRRQHERRKLANSYDD